MNLDYSQDPSDSTFLIYNYLVYILDCAYRRSNLAPYIL